MNIDYPIDQPVALDERGRVELTASCLDCSDIPKHPEAGKVVTDEAGRSWQIMHNGIQVLHGAYQGDYMANIISMLHGHHEPQEERAFWEILQRLHGSPTMVELGAWWGYYSLWFAHSFPTGKAILVEPDEDHLNIGRANFARNNLEASFEIAGGGIDGYATFFDETAQAKRTIETKSVATICESHNVQFLDLLHMDIQGAEVAALTGMETLVAQNRIRFAVVSTHHHRISGDPLTHQKCLRWLTDRNAHIICEHSVNESMSGDGLIVASFAAEDADFTINISHARHSASLFRPLEFDLSEEREAWRAREAWLNGTFEVERNARQAQLDAAHAVNQQLTEQHQLSAERLAKAIQLEEQLSTRVTDLSGMVDRLTNSISWRITSPLRRLRRRGD
jgi:FkbM family methyltransferase